MFQIFSGFYFSVNELLFAKWDSGASPYRPKPHPGPWMRDLPGRVCCCNFYDSTNVRSSAYLRLHIWELRMCQIILITRPFETTRDLLHVLLLVGSMLGPTDPFLLKGNFLLFLTHQNSLVVLKCIMGHLFSSTKHFCVEIWKQYLLLCKCVCARVQNSDVLKEHVPPLPYVSYKVIKLKFIAMWMW